MKEGGREGVWDRREEERERERERESEALIHTLTIVPLQQAARLHNSSHATQNIAFLSRNICIRSNSTSGASVLVATCSASPVVRRQTLSKARRVPVVVVEGME